MAIRETHPAGQDKMRLPWRRSRRQNLTHCQLHNQRIPFRVSMMLLKNRPWDRGAMWFGEKPSWFHWRKIAPRSQLFVCKCYFILKRVWLYHARTKIIPSFLKFWVTKLGRQRCEFDLQTSPTCDVWFFHFTASIEIETRRYTNCALNILHQIEHS